MHSTVFITDSRRRQGQGPLYAGTEGKAPQEAFCFNWYLRTHIHLLVALIRKIHQELLISLGCQVDCVSSVKQALRQLYYDLVLLDIGLPDMSGESVIQTIRAKEAERKPLPITIVSAYGKENEKSYLDLGANHVLSKPITKEQLQSLLKIDTLQKKDDPIP